MIILAAQVVHTLTHRAPQIELLVSEVDLNTEPRAVPVNDYWDVQYFAANMIKFHSTTGQYDAWAYPSEIGNRRDLRKLYDTSNYQASDVHEIRVGWEGAYNATSGSQPVYPVTVYDADLPSLPIPHEMFMPVEGIEELFKDMHVYGWRFWPSRDAALHNEIVFTLMSSGVYPGPDKTRHSFCDTIEQYVSK